MWQEGTFDEEVLAEGTVSTLQSYETILASKWEYQQSDPFYDWKCQLCGTTDQDALQEGSTWFVCTNCGCCQTHLGIHMDDTVYDKIKDNDISRVLPVKRDGEGKVLRDKVSYGFKYRRRYKREFYYRERLAQWVCEEPILKKHILEKFDMLLWSGIYGSQRFLTRGSVFQMCKDNKMCKYKENWKSILKYLTEKDMYKAVPRELLYDCATRFNAISKMFDKIPKHEMNNYLKGSKGKNRHHILHVNYIHRKILESYGIYEYHREFPLLRTPSKIHALDDIMQKICNNLDINFTRTAVVLPPKCKNRFKKKPLINSFSVYPISVINNNNNNV